MTARVALNEGTAIALDPITGKTGKTTQGVLLSLEGKVPGQVHNCCVIPLDRIRAVIASLELAAHQARSAG